MPICFDDIYSWKSREMGGKHFQESQKRRVLTALFLAAIGAYEMYARYPPAMAAVSFSLAAANLALPVARFAERHLLWSLCIPYREKLNLPVKKLPCREPDSERLALFKLVFAWLDDVSLCRASESCHLFHIAADSEIQFRLNGIQWLKTPQVNASQLSIADPVFVPKPSSSNGKFKIDFPQIHQACLHRMNQGRLVKPPLVTTWSGSLYGYVTEDEAFFCSPLQIYSLEDVKLKEEFAISRDAYQLYADKNQIIMLTDGGLLFLDRKTKKHFIALNDLFKHTRFTEMFRYRFVMNVDWIFLAVAGSLYQIDRQYGRRRRVFIEGNPKVRMVCAAKKQVVFLGTESETLIVNYQTGQVLNKLSEVPESWNKLVVDERAGSLLLGSKGKVQEYRFRDV